MKSKFLTFLLLLALALVPTSTAHAQSPGGGDVVLIGDNYVVKSGETLSGSLVVIGGNVTVEEKAIVSGDVVVIGGNAVLNGDAAQNAVAIGGNVVSSAKVSGDMVAIGGQINLKKTAVVQGNVVMLGGQLVREEGSQIGGEIVNNAPPISPFAPSAPGAPSVPGMIVYENPALNLAGEFGKSVALAAIAMLLALFFQPQMGRVADTIVNQPFLSGSYGLLTIVLTPLAVILMIVTIILIPVAAIVALIVLPCAWIFGMVALGQELGERFTKAINQNWSPVLTTGFGAFLLTFTLGALNSVPSIKCLGALASVMISLVVVGGVMKTWLESRNATKIPAPVAVAAEIPPAA